MFCFVNYLKINVSRYKDLLLKLTGNGLYKTLDDETYFRFLSDPILEQL